MVLKFIKLSKSPGSKNPKSLFAACSATSPSPMGVGHGSSVKTPNAINSTLAKASFSVHAQLMPRIGPSSSWLTKSVRLKLAREVKLVLYSESEAKVTSAACSNTTNEYWCGTVVEGLPGPTYGTPKPSPPLLTSNVGGSATFVYRPCSYARLPCSTFCKGSYTTNVYNLPASGVKSNVGTYDKKSVGAYGALALRMSHGVW